MKIKEVHINNFKALNAFSFNPKRINLLVGRNNTGKTSALEAINYLFNVGDVENEPDISYLVNVSAQEAKLSAEYDDKRIQLILKKPDIQTTERLLKNQLIDNFKKIEKFFLEEVKSTKDVQEDIEKLLTSPINNEVIQKISETSLVAIQDEKEYLYFPASLYIMNLEESLGYIASNYLSKKFGRKTISHFVPRLLVMRRAKAMEKRQVIFIRRLCQQYGPVWSGSLPHEKKNRESEAAIFSEIGSLIKKYELLDYFDSFGVNYDLIFKKDNKILKTTPLALMGDGFKAMVSFLRRTLQSHVENKVILIEEPETHMHPGYVKELVDYIIEFSKKRNVQFFITTHNIDLIESFLSAELPESERQFLTDEFSILRMEHINGRINTSSSDYKTALSDKNELLNDLRGT